MATLEQKKVIKSQLNETAFNILMGNLQRYGNRPNLGQQKALRALIELYTDMAFHDRSGRYAFPLPTGAGKTQSIVAWVTALAITKPFNPETGAPISLAVSASKVEALCDLSRDMHQHFTNHKASVQVGIWHTYRFDPEKALEYLHGQLPELPPGYASMPCSSSFEDRQVLLLTHNRVRKGEQHIDDFNNYLGRKRDLLIYDESLLISDARGVATVDIESAVGWLRPKLRLHAKRRVDRDNKTLLIKLSTFLDNCLKLIFDEIKSQRAGAKPKSVHLPGLESYETQKMIRVLDTFNEPSVLKPIKDLLSFSQEELRVVETPQGSGGIVYYDLVVSKDLKNIVILDASYPIRELVHLDSSIQTVPVTRNFGVSYENVTIKHLKHGGGRGSLTQNFRKRNREDRKISLEICEAIKGIPKDEGVLIFTFKKRPRGPDFREILERDLRAEGVDTDAMIEVGGEKKERFVWLTWGNETSLSKHSYCKHVILAGVLFRSHVDLASAILGQMDDLEASVPKELISRIEQSEVAHCVYQAMSRGNARIISEGKAGRMTLYLIYRRKDIREALAPVLHNVKWEDWDGVYVQNETKAERVARKIAGYLSRLSPEVKRISIKKIRNALDLHDVPSRTFSRAIEILNTEFNFGWAHKQRSFERLFACV